MGSAKYSSEREKLVLRLGFSDSAPARVRNRPPMTVSEPVASGGDAGGGEQPVEQGVGWGDRVGARRGRTAGCSGGRGSAWGRLRFLGEEVAGREGAADYESDHGHDLAKRHVPGGGWRACQRGGGRGGVGRWCEGSQGNSGRVRS